MKWIYIEPKNDRSLAKQIELMSFDTKKVLERQNKGLENLGKEDEIFFDIFAIERIHVEEKLELFVVATPFLTSTRN